MRQTFFLLSELVKRDFVGRYAGSLLGIAWSFAQPLWLLALFGFVFGLVLKVPLDGENTASFGVFVLCGLLPWSALQEGLMRSATAVTDNASLVKKLRFPSQILVLTVVATAMFHEAIGLLLFLIYLAARGELAWQSLPWLFMAVPLRVGLTLGLGLMLAAIQVYFRDVVQVLGMLLSGWFYLTPIVYPLRLVPETLRPWIEWNPFSTIVGLYRRGLLGAEGPSTDALLLVSFGIPLMLLAGWWLFGKLRPSFPDEL